MLTPFLDRLRGARRDDAGFSLAELLVAMVVAAIVGIMTVSITRSVNTVSAATVSTSNLTAASRGALLSWSNYLQVAGPDSAQTPAGPVTDLTPTSITFRAYLTIPTCSTDATCAPVAATTTLITLALNAATGGLSTKVGGNTASYADLARGKASAGSCLFTAFAQGTSLGCNKANFSLSSITSVVLAFSVTSPDGKHTSSFSTQATFTNGVAPAAS